MTLRRLVSLLALTVFVVWLFIFRPGGLGGPATYVVVTGVSMEPTLENGDLVVLQERDTYATGDIVTYQVPEGAPGAGSLVIHRIIGGSASAGFITQGDNRTEPDDWRPKTDDIKGELWLRAPAAGSVVATIRNPAVFGSLAGGVVVVLMMLGKPEEKKPTKGKTATEVPVE